MMKEELSLNSGVLSLRTHTRPFHAVPIFLLRLLMFYCFEDHDVRKGRNKCGDRGGEEGSEASFYM